MNPPTDDGYDALTRVVPLRPINSTEGLDRAIAQLNALSDRRPGLTPGELDYMLVLGLIVEHYEGLIYPDPPEN